MAVGLLLGMAGPAMAGAISSSFVLDGAVDRPATFDTAALAALPQQTRSVTYLAGSAAVSESYTGASLWGVVSGAGLQAPPGTKNGGLRDIIVARGSDGYAAAFSAGELDPKFGGRPDVIATGQGTPPSPLGADGFARTVAAGDARGGRYVSNLASLTVVQAPTVAAVGGHSAALVLNGLVQHPASYDAAAIAGLPSVTEDVVYTQGGSPVSASFTGTPLWGLLTSAGLALDASIKNQELRYYLLATGSDGYEAAFSLGELDARFGGTGDPDLVVFGAHGPQLVVPGDKAGGRYVSDLVSLTVIDATAVDEPHSHALLLPAALALAAYSVRRSSRASPPSR